MHIIRKPFLEDKSMCNVAGVQSCDLKVKVPTLGLDIGCHWVCMQTMLTV